MAATMDVTTTERLGSDEAARLRRATAIAEINRIYEGIRQRILDQRTESWDAAMDSFAARMSKAFEGIEIAADGSLSGQERAVRTARAVLDSELVRMPHILAAIQERAEDTWADACRVRARRIWAFNYGGAR